ncbi:MAG: glutamate-5-semialdehyde dehydrogenase [Clostridiales bacterium]|nr:glutamate-5-semialdehyde dehydrogenase [Clostridiales bacterium]
MKDYILAIGKKAKEASFDLAQSSATTRNNMIKHIIKGLESSTEMIINENKKDLELGRSNGLSAALLDRLEINANRIEGMISGLNTIINFEDPIHECLKSWRHENGMQITQLSVPLGVIGMIYESRPNVTVDVAGLAIKSGNCVILRGGSEAIYTNKALSQVIRQAISSEGMNPDVVQLVEHTDRALVKDLITMNDYLDVLIPRGGRGLKKAIVAGASVPVIETGEGLCHTYVDESADLEKAFNIVMNAKTQRTGVCNAMETLLVHKKVVEMFLPKLNELLTEKAFEIRACETCLPHMKDAILAVDEDWEIEYLSSILSIRSVESIEEAITHINKYGSGHSEAVVTEHYQHAEKFLNEVDASAVYVNASTRFTDGEVFGFGGEVGISTQKLHARGPMGIKALTTHKYIVRGNGQIRL